MRNTGIYGAPEFRRAVARIQVIEVQAEISCLEEQIRECQLRLARLHDILKEETES